MPYGHVIATGQHPSSIQLQHHPGELKVRQMLIQQKNRRNHFILGS